MVKNDILQDIPLTELPLLIELLQVRLGRTDSTFAVNIIKNVIDWSSRPSTKSYVTLMAPNGDWQSHCTFIGNVQMPNYSSVVIFSLETSNEQLTNGLFCTKRIDWTQPILFAIVPEQNCPVVHRLIKEMDFGLIETHPCYVFRIDKEEALKFDHTSPENTRIGPLQPSYADIVNYEWPLKAEGTETYIEAAINASAEDNVAIFMEDTEELASWAFVSFIGAMAALQTMTAHKRKGYGKVVIKALAAKLAAKGWDPYGTVVIHNEPSQKLFRGLGFKNLPQQVTFFFTSGTKIK